MFADDPNDIIFVDEWTLVSGRYYIVRVYLLSDEGK